MRALYLTLCIVAVTALPPRQYKKVAERRLELFTEKIEPPKEDLEKTKPVKEEPKPVEENMELEDKKEIAEKLPSVRAYYENQSVNVVSSTSATIVDSQEKQYLPQVNYAIPQVNIGRPQINVTPVQSMPPLPQQYVANKPRPGLMEKEDDEKTKKIYTVNVYVNFPDDQDHHDHEYEYEDDCKSGKCWGKTKCKEGQITVKGVCTDRQ